MSEKTRVTRIGVRVRVRHDVERWGGLVGLVVGYEPMDEQPIYVRFDGDAPHADPFGFTADELIAVIPDTEEDEDG